MHEKCDNRTGMVEWYSSKTMVDLSLVARLEPKHLQKTRNRRLVSVRLWTWSWVNISCWLAVREARERGRGTRSGFEIGQNIQITTSVSFLGTVYSWGRIQHRKTMYTYRAIYRYMMCINTGVGRTGDWRWLVVKLNKCTLQAMAAQQCWINKMFLLCYS